MYVIVLSLRGSGSSSGRYSANFHMGYPADAGDPVRRSYGSRRLNTSTGVASTSRQLVVSGLIN